MPIKQIQVVCPANYVTGGAESLHNLVVAISSLGVSATIVYFPFSESSLTPARFQHYGVKVSVLNDTQDTLVIFPEIFPMEALRLGKAKAAIWWLSLDYFRERYDDSLDRYRYIKRALQGRRPIAGIRALRRLLHFSKSYYDESYLRAHGITPIRLTGPISRFYLSKFEENEQAYRENQILYNAAKGKATIDLLIARYPQYSFVPLINLDEHSLLARYQKSKVYADFGHHPGRDRMPRESVVCGCCVITGRKGSAANPFDIPISDCFKLDERSERFAEQFALLVDRVFTNFELVSAKFEPYRREVLAEPFQQLEELRKILALLTEN